MTTTAASQVARNFGLSVAKTPLMMHVTPEQLCTLRLRILATSDLHANLLPWDYYLDRPLEGYGLARVASLVRAAKAETGNCLLFDNGDLIEGSPLAEYAQHAPGGPMAVHPMIAALNVLGCDAATLGNHEFSYGLAHLQSVLRHAAYPVVCANILAAKGADAGSDTTLFQPWVILDRQFADQMGVLQPLRIGVLGLTPPQVLDWDRAVLQGAVQARDMAETARHHIPRMRAAGADIVVVLAHTGIGSEGGSADNVGWQLAGVPGVDALILGHEHQVFPTEGQALLSGAPTVMPGAFGSHLGMIDLELLRDNGQWSVGRARTECRPIATRGAFGEAIALVADDTVIARGAAPSHQAARVWVARPVGQTDVPLHSYFAVVQPDAMQALIAGAQSAHLAEMLVGTRWEGLPVLSSAAPFKTGGRGGPENFTDVPAGPLLMRNAADLYMHPNRFAAIAISGAGVRNWLERAATAYAQILPGKADQTVLHPMHPATCLEMISGLTYRIDLTAPARFSAPTGAANGQAGRIVDLRYRGQEVPDDMMFALATNSYRVGVMASLAAVDMPEVIADGTGTLGSRDVLLRHLARRHLAPSPAPLGWGFKPVPDTSIVLDTSPAATAHLAEIARFAPEPLGLTAEGFLRFRLHL